MNQMGIIFPEIPDRNFFPSVCLCVRTFISPRGIRFKFIGTISSQSPLPNLPYCFSTSSREISVSAGAFHAAKVKWKSNLSFIFLHFCLFFLLRHPNANRITILFEFLRLVLFQTSFPSFFLPTFPKKQNKGFRVSRNCVITSSRRLGKSFARQSTSRTSQYQSVGVDCWNFHFVAQKQ